MTAPDPKFTTPHLLDQYKAYLEDLGRIGARHETARGFYMTVLSALVAFLALAGKDAPLHSIAKSLLFPVGAAGISISILWLVHTRSFGALYRAKFQRIDVMEEHLPFQNYAEEYKTLKSDREYRPVTTVESAVAVVFALLYAVVLLLVWAG